jgi:APA family basic amino acid/polyamine antiporter
VSSPATDSQPQLRRRLGLFDATMLVMGGIIGSGIFVNPAVVAQSAHGLWSVGAWLLGGAIAIMGAFVYAELAARRPEVGGQYAYLRDAWGPLPAFLYGWSLLLVIQSGGMAAVAITFALPDGALAAIILLLLTAINCWGVKAGSNVQSLLMVLKILAIGALVLCGLWLAPISLQLASSQGETTTFGLLAALTPVMFAYGGWQTSSFVAGEMRNPRRDLARGLLLGVIGVVILYTAVAFACVMVLGSEGLANSKAPASDVMQRALGDTGATLIALGIAISTLGFLSQSMLTAPRVYFAMAEDKLFFRKIGEVSETTRVPVFAILLQGAVAIAIALTGTFSQILSYVVSVDFIWFALTGAALFVFRRRDADGADGFRAPGHPLTTGLFVLACAAVVAATVAGSPVNSAIGFGILLAGVPAFLFWRSRQ